MQGRTTSLPATTVILGTFSANDGVVMPKAVGFKRTSFKHIIVTVLKGHITSPIPSLPIAQSKYHSELFSFPENHFPIV